MRDALAQAKVAREFILGKMAEVIDTPRAELSKYAPGISSVQIDPEKIGLLIGKGGETIRALQEEFESQIDVNDEGQVLVYASDRERGDALVDRIRSMTKEVEVGDEFTGKVVKTTTFGAFIELVEGHRRPAAHLQRRPGPPDRDRRGGAQQGRRARTSRWSRSTASVAGSGCVSPTIPRSRARTPRSWRRSPRPRTAASAASAARVAIAAVTVAAAAVATATVTADGDRDGGA